MASQERPHMTEGIVERLRFSVTKGQEPTDALALEAADEIERLQAALDTSRALCDCLRDDLLNPQKEIR